MFGSVGAPRALRAGGAEAEGRRAFSTIGVPGSRSELGRGGEVLAYVW